MNERSSAMLVLASVMDRSRVVSVTKGRPEDLFRTSHRMLLEAAIARAGNQKRAAEMLGISKRVINYWIRELEIDWKEIAKNPKGVESV